MLILPNTIAKKFDLRVIGNSDIPIETIGSLKKQSRNALLWVKNQESLLKIDAGYAIVNSQIKLD